MHCHCNIDHVDFTPSGSSGVSCDHPVFNAALSLVHVSRHGVASRRCESGHAANTGVSGGFRDG